MNVQEHIAKLESLLGRIRRKAAEPRAAEPVVAELSSAPVARIEPPVVAAHVSYPTPAAGTLAARISEPPPPPPPEVEELDIMDAEIVEIEATVAAANPVEAATNMDLDGPDEPIPESAPRVAQSVTHEADFEPPVKTPPPESGRQVVGPPASKPVPDFQSREADLSGGGDVDSLLEADLSGGPISKAPPGGPTMEQLGETVELEGADAPRTELELLMPEPVLEAQPDELELALPKQEFAGGYDAALSPPAGVAGDLERHRREEIQSAAAAPQSFAEPASMPFSSAPVAPVTEVASAPPVVTEPIVIQRPASETLHAAEVIVSTPAKVPETFLELLDASLRL